MSVDREHRLRIRGAIMLAACLAAVVLAAAPCLAASIPAWLDEAITSWNERNPTLPIQFVAIKDSYVWYRVQESPEIGQKGIRDITYKIAQQNGYATTNEEELVTTGRPPSESGPSTAKKCWKRSFVKTLEGQANTTTVAGDHAGVQQRMLTSMICEDGPYWALGYRILQ